MSERINPTDGQTKLHSCEITFQLYATERLVGVKATRDQCQCCPEDARQLGEAILRAGQEIARAKCGTFTQEIEIVRDATKP